MVSDWLGVGALPGEGLGVGLVFVGGHELAVAANALVLVEHRHAVLDPLVRDQLEERRGEHARETANDADHEVSSVDGLSLEHDFTEESEAGNRLDEHDQHDDEHGEQVALDAAAAVKLVRADVAAVDQVEDLEEDESVPDEREVLPLGLSEWVVSVDDLSGKVVLQIEDTLAAVHDYHHNCDHVKCHSEDLTVHVGGHESAMSSTKVHQVGLGPRSGESQGAEDVHDQVDVDELDGVESALSEGHVADDHDDQNSEVCRDLELKESLHVHVDVTAPHDGAHARVEIVRLEHHRRVVASHRAAVLQSEGDVGRVEGVNVVDALTNNCDFSGGDGEDFGWIFTIITFFHLLLDLLSHAAKTRNEAQFILGLSASQHLQADN